MNQKPPVRIPSAAPTVPEAMTEIEESLAELNKILERVNNAWGSLAAAIALEKVK